MELPSKPDSFCNPKDCNSNCYIPVSNANLERYNDSAIKINMSEYVNECMETIITDLDLLNAPCYG